MPLILLLALWLGAAAQTPDTVQVVEIHRVEATRTRHDLRFEVTYLARGNPDLTGLGLRLHFDSSSVSLVEIEQLLEAGLVGQMPVQPDSENLDGDERTDSYVLVAWADPEGQWPGTEAATLFRVEFEPVAESVVRPVIRFSASSSAAGFRFVEGSQERPGQWPNRRRPPG